MNPRRVELMDLAPSSFPSLYYVSLLCQISRDSLVEWYASLDLIDGIALNFVINKIVMVVFSLVNVAEDVYCFLFNVTNLGLKSLPSLMFESQKVD